MVSDCGCVNYENSRATYNQWNSWLNRNNSSTNYTNPTYSYDPAMSFNGSVFDFDNSTFANTYGGMGLNCLGSYMGGYGMPYGGQNYWDWQFNNLNNGNAYNLQSIQMGRQIEREINNPSDRIQGVLSLLQNKIQKNDQEGIIPAYNALCKAVQQMWPNLTTESDIKTAANSLYANYAKKALYQDIRDNGSGMFMRKFWNGFTFGALCRESAEENIEKLTGLPMSREDRAYGKLGKGAGVATGLFTASMAGLGIAKIASPAIRVMKHGKFAWIAAGVSLVIGAITAIGSGNKKSENPILALKSE